MLETKAEEVVEMVISVAEASVLPNFSATLRLWPTKSKGKKRPAWGLTYCAPHKH